MKKTLFEGVGTAIATPFDENGINYKEYDKLVENQISAGVSAIVACGTTGEAATMSYEERDELINHTIKLVDNRVKVIVGTGSNSTNVAIKLSKLAEKAGADGLLVVTPYYNKATQEVLLLSFVLVSFFAEIELAANEKLANANINKTDSERIRAFFIFFIILSSYVLYIVYYIVQIKKI